MNLKRIIIDTDNGERFIYEDFTRGTYLDLSQSIEPVSFIDDNGFNPRRYMDVQTGEYIMWLNLRADTLTVTEALPGNTDYDWLLENYNRASDALLRLRKEQHRQWETIAAEFGFSDIIEGLRREIDDLRTVNEQLRDIIDAEYDRRWSE